MKRISNLQLGQIDLTLTALDREILTAIRNLRYMKTNQIQRLFFPPLVNTPRAALTATMRNLNRLKKLGLITHLDKRVGGVMSGSLGLIWYITEAGNRLLLLGTELQGTRKRIPEPSPLFLRHILAVTECFVQIKSICRAEEDMSLIKLDNEPECWRAYYEGEKQKSIRPDLYAETTSGAYRDHWFIEMDLSTESMTNILDKCRRYHNYHKTGREQKKTGVFPAVLFIVPDEARRQKIKESIQDMFHDRMTKIFLVITPEELHQTLKNGPDMEKLC